MLVFVTSFQAFILLLQKEKQYCLLQNIKNSWMHLEFFLLTFNNLKAERTLFEFQWLVT